MNIVLNRTKGANEAISMTGYPTFTMHDPLATLAAQFDFTFPNHKRGGAIRGEVLEVEGGSLSYSSNS